MKKLGEIKFEEFKKLIDFLNGIESRESLFEKVLRFFPELNEMETIFLFNFISEPEMFTEENYRKLSDVAFNPDGNSVPKIPSFKEIPLMSLEVVYEEAKAANGKTAIQRAIIDAKDLDSFLKTNYKKNINYEKERDKYFKFNKNINKDRFVSIEKLSYEKFGNDSIIPNILLSYISNKKYETVNTFLLHFELRMKCDDEEFIKKLQNLKK